MNETGITRHLSTAMAALKDLFALAGVAAVFAFLLLPLREPVEKALPSVLPAIEALVMMPLAAEPIQPVADAPLEREQQAVAEYIAKRYRVADDAIAGFVAMAYRAGEEYRVDPLLILAVMAIESRYNPVAESSMGAKGLMQIIPKYHQEKLLEHGGEFALLDPEVNIQVGAQILREYLRRFGATEAALQMYGGAMDEPTAQYSGKVLAEKARLKQFLAQALRRA